MRAFSCVATLQVIFLHQAQDMSPHFTKRPNSRRNHADMLSLCLSYSRVASGQAPNELLNYFLNGDKLVGTLSCNYTYLSLSSRN